MSNSIKLFNKTLDNIIKHKLTRSELLIYLDFLRRAGENSKPFRAGIAEIASIFNISQRQASNSLKRLKDIKFIEVIEQGGTKRLEDGTIKTDFNLYKVMQEVN